MTTNRLVSSLNRLAKERLELKNKERQFAQAERRLIDKVSALLSDLGFRLVSANGGAVAARGAPRRRALPKRLKCPECGRLFSYQMHLARHMNAMHRAQKKAPRKATKTTAGKPRRGRPRRTG
ncbi:MAG: hypothetical protein C5B48_07910 [Candidatus Rokuibacteriota bacterium]|nr:MAG: hypothetical protein C5B48_07910 [Candidatus Rokubacteria bacterium]